MKSKHKMPGFVSPVDIEAILPNPTRRERKEYYYNMEHYGLTVGAVHTTKKKKYFPYILFRALLIFMCTYGSLGCAVSSFNLPFSQGLVITSLALVSLYTSFLYYNRMVLYVGYSALMIGYMYYLMAYYLYINSGFQAFMNMLYNDYSDYFKLLSVRQAYEVYSDRYYPVTHAMIFIGVLIIIMLNVTISGYMNIYETAAISLIPPMIGLYIHKLPSIGYLLILFTAFICIIILGTGGYGILPIKTKHSRDFVHIKSKKLGLYLYRSNFTSAIQVFLFSLILSAVLCIITPTFLSGDYENYRNNKINTATDDQIKMLVQNGFSSLINRYASVGGMSRGKLGGVSSVRPNFETDLQVTFSPYSYDTVYLRAYQASIYQAASWNLSDFDYQYAYAMDDIYQNSPSNTAKMTVTNIDADSTMFYHPYQACFDVNSFGLLNVSFPKNSSDSFDYLPYSFRSLLEYELEDNAKKTVTELADSDTFQILTNVPEQLQGDLSALCIEQNLQNLTDSYASTEFSSVNQYRLTVADNIKKYFVSDFTYTMSPGNTPRGRDFVSYFLFTQKRGYCAHFASAAVLLLRTMGVPCRYSEGYCIPLSLMREGTMLSEESPEEWFSGTREIPEELVLSVNVNDSYAHAWVEIWLDGYGFIPFEFTPPSYEDSTSPTGRSGLWGFLSGLIQIQSLDPASEAGGITESSDLDYDGVVLKKSDAGLFLPVLLLLAAVLLFLLMKNLFLIIKEALLIRNLRKRKCYDLLASRYYLSFVSCIQKYSRLYRLLHPKENSEKKQLISSFLDSCHHTGCLPRALLDYATMLIPEQRASLVLLTEQTSRFCFSTEMVSDKEIIDYQILLDRLKKQMKKALLHSSKVS